ncbi:MAG: hypothetical protein HXY40_09430 [Chloroflexi bacterium]|nr:hypothetical protein [Chloroflexota bacterium]
MYRIVVCLGLALLLAACGGPAAPTATPFARYSAQNIIDAFQNAGLGLQNVERDMLVGRDAPGNFSDRYVFQIASIAPQGGQILVFNRDADMQAWRDYIAQLRNSTVTRRDVVYVYEYANIMIQLNSNLAPDVAARFAEILTTLP